MAAFTIHDAGRLSHAYILASADREACLNLAGQIAAAAVCQRGTDAPCGQCRDCRKAMSGIHPDITHIQREGGKAVLTVDQIRLMAADAYVLPNEARRKVYILDEADKMKTPEAQNAALKTLEEPPAGVVFLLCVQNAGALLPTVRSRCVLLNANTEKDDETAESKKLAREYLMAVAAEDEAALLRWCMAHERMEREEAAAFLESVQSRLAEALCGREPLQELARERLWSLERLAERCMEYLQSNVGTRQLFGLLAAEGAAKGRNRG